MQLESSSHSSIMAAEMVNTATSNMLKEMEWAKSIEISELVVCDRGQAKGVMKSIKKRLGSKHANTQFYAVSIIQKATSILEVLEEVLNAMDPKRPEGATDEFVLDLVEQCSFQKQRVIHLVLTSRNSAQKDHRLLISKERWRKVKRTIKIKIYVVSLILL